VGLTQPFAGAMADKVGAGRVLLAGALLVALGTFITPYMTTTWGLILAIGVLSAGGAGMAGPAVLMAATTRLIPPERRGLATGIVNAGGSFGQFVMAPIAAALMVGVGWANAMQVMGLLVLLCLPAAFPAARAIRCRPRPPGRRWWARAKPLAPPCATAATCCWGGLFRLRLSCGLPGHAPARRDRGVRPAHAMGGLVAGDDRPVQHRRQRGHGLGRGALAHEVAAVAGVCHARRGRNHLPAGAQDRPGDAGVCRRHGPDLPVHRAAHGRAGGRFFGPANMATLFGIVMLTHQVGGFLGAWLGGKVFEATGAYDWVWYIDIVLAVGAALIHLPIKEARLVRPMAA
jgi:MFS family permease